MDFSSNITKRDRKRRLKSGLVVVQTRYVLNYREPRTGQRRQLFFERLKDAQRKSTELAAAVTTGTYSAQRNALTVREAVAHWLKDRDGHVKARTHFGYRHVSRYITEPLLIGTKQQRTIYTIRGRLPAGTRIERLLGDVTVADLTTAEIRTWHKLLLTEVGAFTAKRAKSYLAAALKLAAEDYSLRPPAMPSNLGRGRHKEKKAILTAEQVAQLVAAARQDKERGIYYAFPFLTGTRPSEQLALLWEDVDFDRNVVRVRRMQEQDGSTTNLTKTAAGTRDIPMAVALREMLLEWRLRCPRREGELYRVFPGLVAAVQMQGA